MYRVVFSPRARQQYLKLEKGLQRRVSRALRKLFFRPETHLKRLVGSSAYCLRVGKYRVLLDLHRKRQIMLVTKIGHRKNVYRDI